MSAPNMSCIAGFRSPRRLSAIASVEAWRRAVSVAALAAVAWATCSATLAPTLSASVIVGCSSTSSSSVIRELLVQLFGEPGPSARDRVGLARQLALGQLGERLGRQLLQRLSWVLGHPLQPVPTLVHDVDGVEGGVVYEGNGLLGVVLGLVDHLVGWSPNVLKPDVPRLLGLGVHVGDGTAEIVLQRSEHVTLKSGKGIVGVVLGVVDDGLEAALYAPHAFRCLLDSGVHVGGHVVAELGKRGGDVVRYAADDTVYLPGEVRNRVLDAAEA